MTLKITLEQANEIRRRLSAGEKAIPLAREFGVHQSYINRIRNGAVSGQPKRVRQAVELGESATRRCLDALADGVSIAELARRFGVNKSRIAAIRGAA